MGRQPRSGRSRAGSSSSARRTAARRRRRTLQLRAAAASSSRSWMRTTSTCPGGWRRSPSSPLSVPTSTCSRRTQSSRSTARSSARYYPLVATFPDDDQSVRVVANDSAVFGAAAVRRSTFLDAGGLNERLRSADDWNLWMRLVLSGSRIGLVDEPLYRYRLHEGGTSADQVRGWRDCVEALEDVLAVARPRGEERAAVLASLERHRSMAALTEAEAALRAGTPDRRSRSLGGRPHRGRPADAGQGGLRGRAPGPGRHAPRAPRGPLGPVAPPKADPGPVSLRRAETRFLLPRAPSSAAVLGELPGWAEGLAEAGVEPAPPDRADLVVAPAAAAREALALDPELLLLEGRPGRRRLSATGRHSLVRPRAPEPRPAGAVPPGRAGRRSALRGEALARGHVTTESRAQHARPGAAHRRSRSARTAGHDGLDPRRGRAVHGVDGARAPARRPRALLRLVRALGACAVTWGLLPLPGRRPRAGVGGEVRPLSRSA